MVEKNIVRIAFSNRIDKELLKELKIIAVREEKELYVVLEEAVRNFVAGKNTKKT